MFLLKLTLLVLLYFSFQQVSCSKSNEIDVCALWSNDWKHSSVLRDHVFTNVEPSAGVKAGKYSKVKVKSWNECVALCCQFNRCNVAYWISPICFHIECLSDDTCRPINAEKGGQLDDVLYLQVRSVHSTAAALDYDDSGSDECNKTQPCQANERCEQVSINAQLKRNVCLCDNSREFRRINGVCRQFMPDTKPCVLYDIDDEPDANHNDYPSEETERRRCAKNEECVPPSDRAKHGYCQCKIGFVRNDSDDKCVMDASEISSTVSSTVSTASTRIPILSEFEVEAGDDQTITLPKDEIDLNGYVLFKSNRSRIDMTTLQGQHLNLVWALKSSTNGAKIDITNQANPAHHILIKQLREGIYEFELKLSDQQERTLASDIVKIEVLPTRTTAPPLVVRVPTLVTVNLPKPYTKIEATIEPNDRAITYKWTYANDGPVYPLLENANTSAVLISNLRPGNYTFRLDVADSNGNRQRQTVQLVVTGDPIEARVVNHREIVFWPSNYVILDGSPSIIEQQVNVYWTFVSNDNRQETSAIDIVSPYSLKTRISNLRIGQYKFQLTLTTQDKKYMSKAEVLVVVYAQNGQPPKISIHLETSYVDILNNLVILNATSTTADYGIAKWVWTKSPLSPAMGYFINDSNLSPVAYITNLIVGQYTFILQVYDDRQQMSEMNITVNVNDVRDKENLVEIKFLAKPFLHQQTLDNLLAQIRVFLIDKLPNIEIIMVGMLEETTLLIKGQDSKTNLIISPKVIANSLQDKIESLRSASNMNIRSINTHLCLFNCSNHGQCDHKTKRCVCQKYYMQNWFKSIYYREPNCDFIIYYFVIITSSSAIFAIVFCLLCTCCCLRWRRRRFILARRKRIRYQLLNENDDDDCDDGGNAASAYHTKERNKNKSNTSKQKKNKTSTIVISESDVDQSDENEEQTLYDKPLLTAKMQTSPPKPKKADLKVSVQDTNGASMLSHNGQSSVASQPSVA